MPSLLHTRPPLSSANLFRIKIYVLGFKNIAGLGGWLNDWRGLAAAVGCAAWQPPSPSPAPHQAGDRRQNHRPGQFNITSYKHFPYLPKLGSVDIQWCGSASCWCRSGSLSILHCFTSGCLSRIPDPNFSIPDPDLGSGSAVLPFWCTPSFIGYMLENHFFKTFSSSHRCHIF